LLVWNHDIAAFIVVTYIIFKNLCFLYSEQQKMNSDPTYNINMSGDIKQMLKELGTEEGKETALHGGGGGKAQKERAAALAAILAARSQVKEDSKSNPDGAPQALSIVDAASAAVHGRSAAAAKASSSDKTAARIAMHVAGDRAPVNAKMVRFLDTSF
jgi:peptidyl-prolyl cis-trans isomerase-like protein 2